MEKASKIKEKIIKNDKKKREDKMGVKIIVGIVFMEVDGIIILN